MVLLAAILAMLADARAEAEPLSLVPDVPARGAGLHAQWMPEPGPEPLSVDAALARHAAGRFAAVGRAEPDFGFRRHALWIAVPVRATAAVPEERILHLGSNFMTEMTVWLVQDGRVEEILHQPSSLPFATRPVAFRELAAPLRVPVGQSLILIRYRSEGSTALPIGLETPASFLAQQSDSMALHFLFYGAVLLLVAAGVAATALVPRPVFAAYAFYVGTVLIFLLQRDGYAFQYLWPNAPVWNEFSSLPLGALMVVGAAQFSRSYLETAQRSRGEDRVLLLLMALAVLLVVAAVRVPVGLLKQLSITLTTGGALVFVGLGIRAWRREGRRMLFYVLGWSGIVVASIVVVSGAWLGLGFTRAQTLTAMRMALVFDSIMMGLAVVSGVVALRRDRDRLLRERMGMLDQNLVLMNRLARLEHRYTLARTLADTNSRLLADTSHDLRQPIFALRAALSDLLDGNNATRERVSAITDSLAYMESVVEDALRQATTQAMRPAGEEPTGREEVGAINGSLEIIPVGLLVATLVATHAADARARNVRLRSVNAQVPVRAHPVAVLRIAGNLLANAIRYGAGGKVLVGARLAGEHVVLEIHDEGPGMHEAERTAVMDRSIRGSAAQRTGATGHGLGLAIVADQARRHGLNWTLENRTGGAGMVARLWLPRAGAGAGAGRTARSPEIGASHQPVAGSGPARV